MEWQPFILSIKLAAVTTVVLFLMAIPLTFVVRFYTFRFQPAIKAIISLPLVLPPTVLGFYLLVALNPDSAIGSFFNDTFGIQLVFSFTGLVIGSVIYSLPFMVNPVFSALENLPNTLSESAIMLEPSRFRIFRRILLPNVKTSLIVGSVMTFAHTIGEFGVVLMIGGNIPLETRTASIAIYNEVEALNYAQADQYALILLGFSALVLIGVYWLERR